MLTEQQIRELEETARHLRVEILKMLHTSQSGHTGGSLSAIDVMTALFFQRLRHDPSNPHWEDRDRFVLSKGHAAPALYACLAGCDYFPQEDLKSLRRLGSHLQGHPDMNKTPGVEVCTGSLGQGLSQAVGLALAARLAGRPSRTYVLLGDGEMQEGQVWEAVHVAPRYGAGNLTAIVDWNGLQQYGWPLAEGEEHHGNRQDPWAGINLRGALEAFGWRVLEIDGHDFGQILAACEDARSTGTGNIPTAILAHTIKGRGISFTEGRSEWHARPATAEETEAARRELHWEGRVP
jgi:transketolase